MALETRPPRRSLTGNAPLLRIGKYLRVDRSPARENLQVRHRKFDRQRTASARSGADSVDQQIRVSESPLLSPAIGNSAPNESTALPQSRDEFRWCSRSQQGFSRSLGPESSGQGADADQVVVHQLSRHCDDEDQVDQIVRAEPNAFFASA